MRPDELKPAPGSRKKRRRVGRGRSAGQGKTSGRGHGGDGSRSGGGVRPGFEGGQTPLAMRTPKLRGQGKGAMPTGMLRKHYAEANIASLNRFEAGTTVDLDLLVAHNLCRKSKDGLRVLGRGELTVALTVQAKHFTASAREKIEAAGGQAVVVGAAG